MESTQITRDKKEPGNKQHGSLGRIATNKVTLLNKTLAVDCTDPKIWLELVNEYKALDNPDRAIFALTNALGRVEDFNPDLYFSLGDLLDSAGKHREASAVFLRQKIMQDANGMTLNVYNKDDTLKNTVNYTEYYEHLPLEDTILYESFHGNSLSCNPYALFLSLIEDHRFREFKHIYVINDKSKIPHQLKSNKNIIFIRRGCDAYMRYLATAKYLINNVSFPEYFIRKNDQTYLNTWHGTPIKFLGKDIKDQFMAHKNVTRNFLQASHLIHPNEYTANTLSDRYDIKEIYTGINAITGYPRQDLMINISEDKKSQIRTLTQAATKEITVLYAPTWRGSHGKAEFDIEKLTEDLEILSSIEGINLLFRGHHMIENLINNLFINATIVPDEIDTNSLLSIVDILITDYSSIAFDFMARKKPIFYYDYDRESYETERGLYLPLESLGKYVYSDIESLRRSLQDCIEKPIEIDLRQVSSEVKYCQLDDGNATQRVIDLVFFQKESQITLLQKSKKIPILFYSGPFIPNGISTSFNNLIHHIDTNKYSVNIAIEPHLIQQAPDRLQQIQKLPKAVKLIPRTGRFLSTLEEKWIQDKFNAHRDLTSSEMHLIMSHSYKREFKRLFGVSTFSAVVNFEGYNTFWGHLFVNNEGNPANHIVYLHNDMHQEWKVRYPYLEKNIRLYSNYDTLLSVSKQTNENNRSNLAKLFNIEPGKFSNCDNVQHPENCLSQSLLPLESQTDGKYFNGSSVFINIARLSPEKGQGKLIRAFKVVVQKYPSTKLINIGSGPLESELKSLIKELKLTKNVFLLGQKSNPYPYLKASSCFILSSDHEGQPMTLFEAMILKKPIIATDIVGNRSVLEDRPGLLVENNEEGLINGMVNFIEGEYIETQEFDYSKYNSNALQMFYKNVANQV